jgi:hypothetical protein
MIKEETLFILGAGASKPYGYPTGQELREKIISQFPGIYHRKIQEYYANAPSPSRINEQMTAVHDFVDAFERSTEFIDKFLSMNPKRYPDIGRRAITVIILEAEMNSSYRERAPGGKDEDWYTLLYRTMTQTLSTPDSLEEFSKNKVRFITFNYDRSLEHFLFDSLSYAFDDRGDEIRDKAKKYFPFPIIHVYGQIDKPEWGGGLPYKQPLDFARIHDLKNNIKLIGDRTEVEKDEIVEHFEWAKRIYFLGFGYADENLDAIGIRDFISSGMRGAYIYGTARGSTSDEIHRIKRRFLKEGSEFPPFQLLDEFIKLEPVGCYSLLRHFPLI